MKITYKSISEYFSSPKYTVVEFFEETEQTRQCYHFTVYKSPKLKHLNTQYVTTVGKDDGYYHEGEKEDYSLKLMTTLESKALQQKEKERTIKVIGLCKTTTIFY